MATPVGNIIARLIRAGYPEGTARKIASGELSMDQAAKAARMSEQGYFDIYHGGAGDISAFDPATFGGSTTGAKSAQMATWGVDDPRVAETYARYAGEDVPVQRLIQEADAAGRRGDFDLQERLYLQAEALEQSGELVGGGGQNIMPLMARGNYLDKDAKGGTLSDLDEGQIAQWVQEAKDKGYDGVRIRDFSDNADYGVYLPATHYGIIDPTKIRSRFAAFDPDELDNPNILAGLGGAGVVGAGLMASDEVSASPLDDPERAESRANLRAVQVASDTLERLRRERGAVASPLQDTRMARFGDYLTENRPSEMDPVQRALQSLGLFQGLGEYLRTTGEGQRTTTMQDINAALDVVPL